MIVRMLRLTLFFCMVAGAGGLATAQARECDFSRPPPPGWRRVDTEALSLYLPRDAYAKQAAGIDTSLSLFEADGLVIDVDYGFDHMVKFDEPGAVNRLLGGAPAAVLIEVNQRGGGRLGAGWSHLGLEQYLAAALSIRVRDASRWDDACRIAASVRLLGAVERLQLVRIGTSHDGQRFAELRDGDAAPRRLFVGDYASQDWGRISTIDAKAVTITQLVRNSHGGFDERVTRLQTKGR